MPLNQRRVIAEAIEGKQYVEWGVGGTTAWLMESACPYAAMSIEHDAKWYSGASKLFASLMAEAAFTGRIKKWMISLHDECMPGANATKGEESATDAEQYINAGISILADVYLIDGVVRAQCLRALVDAGRPCTVFLHDTQRDWYDDAIQYAIDHGATRTDYPEGEDYPGCLLTRLNLPGV